MLNRSGAKRFDAIETALVAALAALAAGVVVASLYTRQYARLPYVAYSPAEDRDTVEEPVWARSALAERGEVGHPGLFRGPA
jgi:hypothetical protein